MDQDRRFSRQQRFAPFGAEGHARWRELRVAVIGLGGLGAALAELCARSGVGALVLVDRDVVEESNLPRQLLYTAADATEGKPKAEAAALHLEFLEGPTRLDPRPVDFSVRTAPTLLDGVDLVLDGLDNFEGRYLLNDACHRAGIPWVYGGAVGGSGAAMLLRGGGRPCLRCVFPESPDAPPPETCETVGVLSPLPTLVAALQVTEAQRWAADPEATGRLWHLDPWSGRAFVSPLPGSLEDCPCCTHGRHPSLEATQESLQARLCGRGTIQVLPSSDRPVDLDRLVQAWQGLGPTHRTRFLARLETEGLVVSVFPDGRALIQGTDSEEQARGVYARFVGC